MRVRQWLKDDPTGFVVFVFAVVCFVATLARGGWAIAGIFGMVAVVLLVTVPASVSPRARRVGEWLVYGRFRWPPLTTDYVLLCSLALVGLFIAYDAWEGFAVAALLVAIVCGLWPALRREG